MAGAAIQINFPSIGLDRGETAAGQALVLQKPDGRIDYKTAEADRLLAEWFGTRNGRLPQQLVDWLALARPEERYIERRNGSTPAGSRTVPTFRDPIRR